MEATNVYLAQSLMVLSITAILGMYESSRGVHANRDGRYIVRAVRICHNLAYAMATCKEMLLGAYDRWLFTTVFLEEDIRRTAVDWMLRRLDEKRWHRRALRAYNMENQHPDHDDLRVIESELTSPTDVRHELFRREGCGFLNQGYSFIENVHKPFGKKDYFGRTLPEDFCDECGRLLADCYDNNMNAF